MTSAPAPRKAGLNSGWILVTGLLTLCVLGTWFTARNYRQQVLTSTGAVVLLDQWPERRVSATFPPADAKRLRAGQFAKITVGNDKNAMSGRVLSVGSGIEEGVAMIAVTGGSGNSGSASQTPPPHFLDGAACSVTVDTSIPVDAAAMPASTVK